MTTQTLNISLPRELVKKIDILAKKQYTTRSGFIRQALIEKINRRERLLET